jgi:copper chaperone CopZ
MASRRVRIDIDGMTCDGCVRSVDRVLSRLEGVTVVGVEVGSARVEVDDARASEQELTAAIEKAGFTPRGVSPA